MKPLPYRISNRVGLRPLFAPFPYPTKYTAYDPNHQAVAVNFKYLKCLEDGAESVIFLAESLNQPSSKVVVKFVDRYGAGAHRLLANAGRAPKLHYFGSLDGEALMDDPNGLRHGLHVGPIRMVVMDFVSGETAHELMRHLSVWPPYIKEELRRTIETLHAGGYVFGDLRPPNVICDGNKVQLIDFNWAGKKGVARYPRRLSSTIKWVANIKDLQLITEEHDWEMLEKHFG